MECNRHCTFPFFLVNKEISSHQFQAEGKYLCILSPNTSHFLKHIVRILHISNYKYLCTDQYLYRVDVKIRRNLQRKLKNFLGQIENSKSRTISNYDLYKVIHTLISFDYKVTSFLKHPIFWKKLWLFCSTNVPTLVKHASSFNKDFSFVCCVYQDKRFNPSYMILLTK